MGEMSGYDFCRRIKGDLMYSHIPVILLTAKSNITEQVEGLQIGASAYVVKPFDPRYLKALVENQLTRAERVRKLLSEGEPMQKAPDGLSEQDRKFMNQVYELMERHLQDNDLNVTTISSDLLISASKFNYKLKELTGESPGSFFRKFKLNRAARLLREGKYNVSEVAYMTGFGTVSYFSVAFKKQFGVSPSEYK
jgi:AraC-like DNA-binding protein